MYVCVCKNGSDIRALKFPFVFSRVSNDRPWLNIKGGPLLHAHNTDRELHTFESITTPKIEVATKRLHHVCPIEDQEEKGEQTNKPKSLGYFGRQKRQQNETLSGRKDLLLWPFIGKNTWKKTLCTAPGERTREYLWHYHTARPPLDKSSPPSSCLLFTFSYLVRHKLSSSSSPFSWIVSFVYSSSGRLVVV